MARVNYRPYDVSLNERDIELLSDVDQYYPDLMKTLDDLDEPKIFISAWLIMPEVRLTKVTTFEDLIVRELKKRNSLVYLLWNTNYNGFPFPGIRDKAKGFHERVTTSAGAAKERLKIILSTNLQFDPAALSLDLEARIYANGARSRIRTITENPDNPVPLTQREFFQDLWLKAFQPDPEQYRNLAVWTAGCHHQKTVTAIGRWPSGAMALQSYCGGIDFSSGPAGHEKGVFNGGRWWHDLALRVRGGNALPILENFVERWNSDLEGVAAGNTLHCSVSANDTLSVDTLTTGIDGLREGGVVCHRTMPLGGVDWPLGSARITEIRDVYRQWIPKATSRITLVNQYIRDQEIASLLDDRISEDPRVRVTIVIPSYTEEMGERSDLPKIRDDFVNATSSAGREDAERKAINMAFTIDPLNKLCLYAQIRALSNLVRHPSVRIWIPRPWVNDQYWGHPYIHAKLLIVDDQLLMVGSANVNGRSLEGLADSEINLTLTNPLDIQRLLESHRWHIEPESEIAADYKGSWYARHNLVRYTPSHWDIDLIYSAFPKNRGEILEYADKLQKDKRLDQLGLTFDRTMLERLLDTQPIDLSTNDLAELLLSASHHLI